jgi:hypothetical protein
MSKAKTPSSDAQFLCGLLAAKKILDAEIKARKPLAKGHHQIADILVTVQIAGAEATQGAASNRPEFSTFPMDLAVGFLLRRLPDGERMQVRAEMFSLFEKLEREEPNAVAEKEKLEATIEALRKFKKQIGSIPVKGSLKVTAIGSARVARAA